MADEFRTSDFALAAALACLECRLHGLDRTDPRRVVFVFQRNEWLDVAIQQFWARTLQVDPLSYFQAQKALKARLYAD